MNVNADNRGGCITIRVRNLNFELQPDHIIMVCRIRMINRFKLRISIFTALAVQRQSENRLSARHTNITICRHRNINRNTACC